MKFVEDDSPTFIATRSRNEEYSSSLETTTSVVSSTWSAPSSQSSSNSSPSTTSDSDSCDSYPATKQVSSRAQTLKLTHKWVKQPTQPVPIELPADLRQNPRRSSSGLSTRSGCPPSLVRQCERKGNFVDGLVDSSTQIVEAIWPLSSVVCRNELGSRTVLPLRTFIQETLRRSRTSYSTLQVALYYLVLIKPHVPKHDFTMEQPDDAHASRALQCGRRMFLAALILASKYLQDRNYSARAWSKISGLNTQEINQNEMAFLLAVNWKLHITDEVFQRWTDIVLKYTPPAPPAPGASTHVYNQKSLEWKRLILNLNAQLDNITGLVPSTPVSATPRDFCAVSSRSVTLESSPAPCESGYDSTEATPTAKTYNTPIVMEPAPAAARTPGRPAPALGLLPTPRLTPQTAGFSTPAVSATTHMLNKGSAMGLAMAQASHVNSAQSLDRWPGSALYPQAWFPTQRRSSLATSTSTASSPESMVSDSSRSSRSSSISSASSLVSAPSLGLSVPARFRQAKLCAERSSLRPTIFSVPEDYEESGITSSPESYAGPVGKLGNLSLDTPLARRESCLEDMARDPANDAARALHELQNSHRSLDATPTSIPSRKRGRSISMDHSLQDNVRDILSGTVHAGASSAWPHRLVRSRTDSVTHTLDQGLSRKRVCCTADAAQGYGAPGLYPAMSDYRGPGMWEGILN